MKRKKNILAFVMATALCLTTVLGPVIVYGETEGGPKIETEPKEDLEPEIEPEPSVEPKENPESEPSTEPKENPEPEPSTEPKENPEPEPSMEPKENPEPEPSMEPGKDTEPKADTPKLLKEMPVRTNEATPSGVELNATNFPDSVFRAVIAEEYDDNDNGYLSDDEIADITFLSLERNSEITDITGVAYFTSLDTVFCSAPGVTSVDLSKNNTLATFYCNNETLENANLSNLSNLEFVMCANSPIENLDVSQNTNLRTLMCQNTNIKSLDLSNNTALTMVYCGDTKISGLDLSGAKELGFLSCMTPYMTWLNLDDEITLQADSRLPLFSRIFLEVEGDSFDIEAKYPGIDPDKIKNVEGATYDGTGVFRDFTDTGSSTPSFSYDYDCGYAYTFHVQFNGELTGDNIDETFDDPAFREYVRTNIDLNEDGILSPEEALSVREIDVSDLSVSDLIGIDRFPALSSLECRENNIKSLDLSGNKQLLYLDCDENPELSTLIIDECIKLTALSYSDTALKNVDTSIYPNLSELECNNTETSYFNLDNNQELTLLSCNGTKVTSIDVSKQPRLYYLECAYTQVQMLDLPQTNLLMLNTLNCPLVYINLSTDVSILDYDNLSECTVVPIDIDTPTFDIDERYPGIKIANISEVEGATYDPATGIFSEYSTDTNHPKISYTYDCGEVEGEMHKLRVNLNGEATALAINEANFPDEAFRQYISTNFDKGDFGVLSDDEISLIKDINIRGNTQITDLTGIEHFKNLEELRLSNTNVTSIDISSNLNLKYLSVRDTAFTSLDVSKNLKLEELYCYDTNISSLDLSNNRMLEELYCYDTNITSLDLSNNHMLEEVDCEDTPITSIKLVGEYPNLKEIECYNTNLTSLDVTGCPALIELDCCDTKLASLDVSNNPLEILCCNDTPFAWMNLGTQDNLDDADTDIPTTSTVPIEVSTLSFDVTDKFPGIDKSKITVVSGATYDANTGIFSGYDIANPQVIYAYNCGTVLGATAILTVTLDITATELEINATNFPNDAFRAYVKENFDESGNGYLSLSELNAIKAVDVIGQESITDLKGIEHFTELTNLYALHTGITQLDVSKNKKLRVLLCGETALTALDVSACPDLVYLAFEDTSIDTIDLSTQTNLQTIYCYGTNLENIDVSANTDLKLLSCGGPNLISVDVSKNKELVELYIVDSPKITSIDISNNTKLKSFGCHGTNVSTLNLSKNARLEELYIQDTKINGLDLSDLTLKELDYSNAPLAWIDLGTQNSIVGDWSNLPTTSTVTLEVPGPMFDIAEQYPGIDISKISNVKGANFDTAVGVFSNYKQANPVITYDYDSGIINGKSHIITVTMKLTGVKGETILRITDTLSKTYDGKAVTNAPAVEKVGSTGEVTYTWERQTIFKTWRTITGAPKEVGKYRVTASVAEDENYYGATSAPLEFEITEKGSSGSLPGYKGGTTLPGLKTNPTTTAKAPTTSDSSNSTLWVILLILSAGITGVVVATKKHKKAS